MTPGEIESTILQIPGVLEVIASAEKHPMLGNVVVCTVQKSPQHDEAELKRQIKKVCRDSLEKYKRPVKIHFTSESFYSARMKKRAPTSRPMEMDGN